MALEPTTVALIGTVFGGVGLKVMEHLLSKGKVKIDEAATIRSELRMEVTALREENKHLEKDVDTWKLEYYNARDVMNEMKTLLRANKIDLPPPKDE